MPPNLKDKIDKLNFSEEEKKELYKRNIDEVENFVAQEEKLTEQLNLIEQQKLKAEALQKELDGKNIYIKIEKTESLSEQSAILKAQSQLSAKEFIDETIAANKAKLANQKLSDLEKENIAKQAALTTYETLNGKSPVEKIAKLKTLSAQENLNAITTDAEMQQVLKTAIKVQSNKAASEYEIYRQFIDVGKTGEITDPGQFRIKISFDEADLKNGYEKWDLSQEIANPQLELLSNQNDILGNIRVPFDIGIDELKSRLLRSAGDALTKKIGTYSADSLISRGFNSKIVQFGLSQIGLVAPAEWIAVEGSWVGNLIVSTGYGPVAGILQGITGFDFGVVQAIPITEAGGLAADTFIGTETATVIGGAESAALTSAVGATTEVAAEIAAQAGVQGAAVVAGTAAAAGEEIATATGLGALIGNLPGLIIGAVIGLVISALPAIKKFIDKNKGEFFAGGLMMVIAGSTLGSLLAVAVGAPLALLGGAAIVGAGGGIGGFFLAIGGLFASVLRENGNSRYSNFGHFLNSFNICAVDSFYY